MVTIAEAKGFDFKEYLKQLTEVEGLTLKKTNGFDHAEFVLTGKSWPFFAIWELDTFKIKAEGHIDVKRRGDKIELYYGCKTSEEYKRNLKIFVWGVNIPIFIILFYILLQIPGPLSFYLPIFWVIIFFIGIPIQFYVFRKYENIGYNNQSYSFKRRLLRGTLADEYGF